MQCTNSQEMYNIINVVFTLLWICSARLLSFEDLFYKTKHWKENIFGAAQIWIDDVVAIRWDWCHISYRSWASKHIELASKPIELLTELENPTKLSEDTTLQQCVVTPSPSSHGPSHLQACSHYPHFVPLLMIIYYPIVVLLFFL